MLLPLTDAVPGSTGPDSGLAGVMVDLMDKLGLLGAAIAVGLDNVFPPIPSEIVLPLAGFAASAGKFSLTGAIIATTAGSVIGACLLYALGAVFGRDRCVAVFAKIPLVKVSDFERTEAWFAKYGTWAVLLGRMVPLFRSLISLPAGVERMNFAVFFALTTLGSAVWNSIWVGAGYRLGAEWDRVEPWADRFQTLVIAAVLIVIVGFVAIRLNEARRSRAA
jgi:membrane protein DedA with SNARE-associated domain